MPPVPHADQSVPPWHTPPLQHPEQLLELQVAVLLQVPFTHASPALVLQTAQVPPFLPHAAGSLPPLHTLFWQQPTQVVDPHVDEQACVTHLSVPEQTLQAAPPFPQAAFCVPA